MPVHELFLSRLGMNNRVSPTIFLFSELFRSLCHSHESSKKSLDSLLLKRLLHFQSKNKIYENLFHSFIIKKKIWEIHSASRRKTFFDHLHRKKTDINNKFYDIISLSSLSEPCTFFVIFPSSRAAENVFTEEVTTKDVRRNTEFMWESQKGKSLRSGTEKKWSTFGVSQKW